LKLESYRIKRVIDSLEADIERRLALKSDKGEKIDYSRIQNAPTVGGEFSGTMDDIENGTTYVKTENNFTDALASKLSGIEAGAEVNVQPDWNQAADTADDYIKNKPTSFGLTQPQILARNLGC